LDSESESDSESDDDELKDRDWNAEYQTILNMPENMVKYEKLSELSKDFVYTAKVRIKN